MDTNLEKQAASFVKAAMTTAEGVETLVRPIVEDQELAHSKLGGVVDKLADGDVIDPQSKAVWRNKLSTLSGAIEFIDQLATAIPKLVKAAEGKKPHVVDSVGSPVEKQASAGQGSDPAPRRRNQYF